ncbi:MAG: hypothetical protein ACI8XB_001905 [Patiriisocius sp.]|jgi:hypothetical protein
MPETMKSTITYLALIIIIGITGCTKSDGSNDLSTVEGQAGSLAKMIAVENHLYVINDSEMKIFEISNPQSPIYKNTVDVGFGIETLFPFGEHLFIGSVDGMYIYDITDPTNPFLTTEEQVQHIAGCDPVVANENYAYVTLNTLRTSCGNLQAANVLMVYDISDISNVTLISSRSMDGPKGLALDGDLLFICDAEDGVEVFDLSEDPKFPFPILTIDGFTANDLIANNGHMMVVCEDGVRQFDYTNIDNVSLMSFLSTDE